MPREIDSEGRLRAKQCESIDGVNQNMPTIQLDLDLRHTLNYIQRN